MIEITFPPYIEALCKSCETICEKECCGIRAFSFSPFNIIYHLTKINACIRDEDVAEIRSGMAEIVKNLGGLEHSEKVVMAEFNAILTVEQVISLFALIDAALSEGCAIYEIHEKWIDQSDQNFSRIIDLP
jgi:hypothetical protein